MNEEVKENEGKALAKEINAIYIRTSAKLNTCIEEMFNRIGKKFINPWKIKGFKNKFVELIK